MTPLLLTLALSCGVIDLWFEGGEAPGGGEDSDPGAAVHIGPTDLDRDGWTPDEGDCDDTDPDVNPGATDAFGDGIDADCDGADGQDADGDGNASTASGGDDCDDSDASVHRGGIETCDGEDEDCDGILDEGLWCGPRDLESADAVARGEGNFDQCGHALSTAGDFDGDGRPDVVVGCTVDPGGYTPIVGPPYVLIYTSLAFDAGFLISVEPGVGRFEGSNGLAVAPAGDTDGDGLDDVLIASFDSGLGSVEAVLVLGRPDPGHGGVALIEEGDATFTPAPGRVAPAGDTDGDGLDDMLLGVDDSSSGGAGIVYLVRGPVAGPVDLETVAAAALVGETPGDGAGASIAGGGDVDGDGVPDLLIGAPSADAGGADAGAAYLVLGPAEGDLDLSDADARLTGEAADDQAGTALAFAGDVDGDGHADLLVGAPGYDGGAGAAYLVLETVYGDLSLADRSARFAGENADDRAGTAVSSAGDVDGDDLDDLLVGAPGYDGWAGAAYLLINPASGELSLSAADARLASEEDRDDAGYAVASAGDVDADGYDDVLVGAPGAGTYWPGAAYLLLGGPR